MTAQMTANDILDLIPEKLDTLIAAGTAAVFAWQNYRLKNAQTTSAEIDPMAKQVGIIHQMGEDLRTDLGRLRSELADCEKHKSEMTKRQDAQDKKLSDLYQNLADSMTARGVPKKVTVNKKHVD